MKVCELIAYARGVRPESPSHAFSDEVICIWINEIEGMVQSEILLTSPADIITYTISDDPEIKDDKETELLVPAPHSKIYRAYVCAMIDFERGEYSTYANSIELFNDWWREYAAWYALMYDPASGRGEFKGYYVSAYAIAVKHGYKGTEEEWLSELDLRVKDAEGHANNAAASAASAMIAVTKYPMIGEGGYWYVWDTVLGKYVKTSAKGEGSPGKEGNGIESIAHSGKENTQNPATGMDSTDFFSDIYTITFTDGRIFKIPIPRGSRIFTGAYGGPGVSISKTDGIVLEMSAVAGDYFLAISTGHFWLKVSDTEQSWKYICCFGGGASLSNSLPLMDGEASPGVSDEAARADHVHLTDTTRMESAEGMAIIRNLQDTDCILVYDLPGKTMAKIKWETLKSLITSALEGEVYAAGIIDPESGASATIPPIFDDTVLLTEENLTDAVTEALTQAKESGEFDGRGISSIGLGAPPWDEDGEHEYLWVTFDDPDETQICLGLVAGSGVTSMIVDDDGYLWAAYKNNPHMENQNLGRVMGKGVDNAFIDESTGHLMISYTDDPENVQDLGKVVGRGIEGVWIEDGNLKLTYEGIDEIFDLGHVEGRGISRAYIDDDGNLCLEYTDGESEMLDPVVGRGVERMYVDDNGDLYVSYTETPDESDYVGHVKGDPYTLTDADKAEMVDLVLNALPTWEGGSY